MSNNLQSKKEELQSCIDDIQKHIDDIEEIERDFQVLNIELEDKFVDLTETYKRFYQIMDEVNHIQEKVFPTEEPPKSNLVKTIEKYEPVIKEKIANTIENGLIYKEQIQNSDEFKKLTNETIPQIISFTKENLKTGRSKLFQFINSIASELQKNNNIENKENNINKDNLNIEHLKDISKEDALLDWLKLYSISNNIEQEFSEEAVLFQEYVKFCYENSYPHYSHKTFSKKIIKVENIKSKLNSHHKTILNLIMK